MEGSGFRFVGARLLLRARARDSHAALDRLRRRVLQDQDPRPEDPDDDAGTRVHVTDLVHAVSGRLLREPLLHFALLGAVIFGAFRLVAPPASDAADIVITTDRIASITAQFSASHGGRAPREEELHAALDAYVRDEMLYREGLALGLDRDDPVVRSRIRQKADLLSEDALTPLPSDGDLEAYLAAHRADFDIPARVSFHQIYIDPGRHRDGD